ncbi:UTP--glucose-1-phosphate uridylyltransferase [Nannocystis sp.]|uniref:UTP--glucose-1-phosphate uridylyltransferase n=1 Tax=Nannocystis sp. TaxID=1962667 RepID=UPI0025EB6F3E|nr:UTP--glucose-1-phosphate uridylyltransferase [Nannocystis sp.]MBK7826130.1 UTP--glucose-1-phosphate uridylyltransferase [Nannocystis sp.]
MLRPSVAHAAFDPEQFAELRAALLRGALSPERTRLSHAPERLTPEAMTAVAGLDAATRARLTARGEAAIRGREVAALVLNGGMATRFGGAVKGVVPVLAGPGAPSFLAVKLAGLRGVPVVLMHSFATAAASAEHLAAIDWSGVPHGDRLVFEQSLLPRMLADGTPLPALPEAESWGDTLVYAAPGHGDTLRRLRDSGTLASLRARGVRHLLVSNVDNLGATLDPLLLGAHLEAHERGNSLSVEVVLRSPDDAGGCVAGVGGRPQIIEGFRLPAGVAIEHYPHFNTNTLWVALDALTEAHPLTWFAVRKAIDLPEGGAREVLQFEQLIGQLSEFVATTCLLVDRARFLPIKSREELRAAAPQIAGLARAAGLAAAAAG